MPLPKITVITPTYNQGKFIQDTIDSVLNQGYPNLEYLIMDAGSTDDTIKILQKYANQIKWVSEHDKGQADAINKGLKRATGDIIAFINSDDYYLPGTFNEVARVFTEYEKIAWVTGNYCIVSEDKKIIQPHIVQYKNIFRKRSGPHTLRLTNYIAQPSTFWRKKINEDIGYLDSSLNYAFDYDFWMRLIDNYPHKCINRPLSAFRIHNHSKSGTEYHSQFQEEMLVLKRYDCSKFEYNFHCIHNWLIIKSYDLIK